MPAEVVAGTGASMRLLLALVLLVAASSCKSQCRQLSEKLCECATNTNDRTICLQAASVKDSLNVATSTDQDNCKVLLATCDCHLTNTRRGKVRCGMARPYPGYDDGL